MKISRLGWKLGIGAMAALLALSGWSGKPVHAASASSVAASSSVSIGQDISGHWAESTLRAWIQEGLLTGDDKGRVDPDRTITRAELMTLANRALGLTEAGPIAFSDVKAAAWYAEEIAIAVQAGYVTGYSDGTARPNQTVTRQETAAMLASLAKKPLGAYAGAAGESVGFADSSAIGAWSLEAVKAVARLQVMGGFTDGTFRPNSPITRAEAIVALDRLKKLAPAAEQEEDLVYSEAGTYGPESGQEVISGDVSIQVGGVTLRNVTIKGDLTLSKEVGEGDVTLDHVTVEGETFVYGGGANSVHFIDSIIESLLVNKEGSSIRILAQGTSQIASAEFRSMATFVVETGAKVETFIVRAVVKVTGQGVIVNARLYVSGTSFESSPQSIEAAEGVQYFIGTLIPGGSGSSGGGPIIDAAPTVTGVVYGETYTSAVTPASADKDIAGVTLMKDGVTVEGYKLGDEISENGSYELTVTDKGRNSTVVSFIVNIPAPDLAPVVAGVEHGKTYAVAVTPTSADEDIASVELTKDDVKVEGYELGDKISENGSYVLTVTDAGNHSTVMSFIVNIPAPDLAPVVAGVEHGKTYAVAVTPTSADTDIASVELTKDDVKVEDYELGDEISENGNYKLTLTDLGGHSTVVSFIVNIPAPDLAPVIDGVEDGETYTVAVTPSSADEDIASVELTKDEVKVTGYKLGDEIVENGSYKLTVTDLGGHSTVVSFIVNIPAPDLAPVITGVEDGETYTVAVTPSSADEDIASVELTKDDVKVEGYELGDEIVGNGSYELTVTDLGGHSTVVSFVVNIPAPDLAPVIDGVEDGETYTVAVTPSSADEDIASVELTKDDVKVEGYEMGDEIVENGSYVLTVTDAGNHSTVVSFELDLPVQIIPDLASIRMEDTELTLDIRVTNTGEDIDNVINGVRVNVPDFDGDTISGYYNDGSDYFTLYRVGNSDDFVGYFPQVYDYDARQYVNYPYTLSNGWDTLVGYGINLWQFTEPKNVKVNVWIADADSPAEENALYRMREVDIPLEANYIGPISDLRVISTTSDSVTIEFTYPTGGSGLVAGYGAAVPVDEDSPWNHYMYPYVEDIILDELTGKGTLELWPSFARGESVYLQLEVYGGKYDGVSNVVLVDMAPAIEGVYNDGVFSNAVTPYLYGANDVESVTLTKDDAVVPDYELGTQLSENGEYVLTVTDAGGNATTIRFTIIIAPLT